jgi:cell division protein FtsL
MNRDIDHNNIKSKKRDTTEQMPHDLRLIRLGMYIAAIVAVIIFLSMTTCTMHSNTYDDERADAEVKIQQSENETEVQKETLRLATLERIVEQGANPIAVRCAILGWSNNNKEVCLVAAANSKMNMNQIKEEIEYGK